MLHKGLVLEAEGCHWPKIQERGHSRRRDRSIEPIDRELEPGPSTTVVYFLMLSQGISTTQATRFRFYNHKQREQANPKNN